MYLQIICLYTFCFLGINYDRTVIPVLKSVADANLRIKSGILSFLKLPKDLLFTMFSKVNFAFLFLSERKIIFFLKQ